MKAVVFDAFGDADVLYFAEVPKPVAGKGELLVKVSACGLNRADILQRQGYYPPPPGASQILGLELAGEVVDVGPEVSLFQPGDRVFGLVEGGAYGEYCLLHEKLAVPTPDSWEDAFAAAVAETFFTANETLFHLGGLTSDERVLIHAGSSGVGTTAIQMARLRGARIATTSGSAGKIEKLRELGADCCVDYKQADFLEEVLSWSNGTGVDLIIDFVGAAYLDRNLRALKACGRLVLVGFLGGVKAELDLRLVLTRRLHIMGSVMRSLSLEEKMCIRQRFCESWLPMLLEKKLQPVICEKIPIKKVREAHKMMEGRKHFGKIVLAH